MSVLWYCSRRGLLLWVIINYTCNSIPDKAATSSSSISASYADAKRRNIATSAKILGPVDGAEPMDVDVTSVTSLASTNQMKGVTNAGLNLQREPLQKNSGGNSEKGTV